MHRVLRGLEWGFRQRTLRHLTPPVIRPHPLSSFKSFTTISQYSSPSSSLSSSSSSSSSYSSSSRQELPSCPPNLNEQHRRGGDPGECHILPPDVPSFWMFVCLFLYLFVCLLFACLGKSYSWPYLAAIHSYSEPTSLFSWNNHHWDDNDVKTQAPPLCTVCTDIRDLPGGESPNPRTCR